MQKAHLVLPPPRIYEFFRQCAMSFFPACTWREGQALARRVVIMEPEMPHQGPFRLTPPCERENGTTVIKFIARVTLETRRYVFKLSFYPLVNSLIGRLV